MNRVTQQIIEMMENTRNDTVLKISFFSEYEATFILPEKSYTGSRNLSGSCRKPYLSITSPSDQTSESLQGKIRSSRQNEQSKLPVHQSFGSEVYWTRLRSSVFLFLVCLRTVVLHFMSLSENGKLLENPEQFLDHWTYSPRAGFKAPMIPRTPVIPKKTPHQIPELKNPAP